MIQLVRLSIKEIIRLCYYIPIIKRNNKNIKIKKIPDSTRCLATQVLVKEKINCDMSAISIYLLKKSEN